MRRIGRKTEPSVRTLEQFIAILKEKYGPTFTIDMNRGERNALVALRSEVDFAKVAADDVTYDLVDAA